MTDELHAEQWLTIPGRGKVAVISTPCSDPSLLRGQVVLIDGKQYLVRGVEMFRPRKPESPYGLLVKEYDDGA